MQRCVHVACFRETCDTRRRLSALLPVLLIGLASCLASTAWAQAPRSFNAQALRGELVVTAPPEVRLNGQPGRLAPGARIRGADNMLQLSGTLVNQRLLVHYTVDIGGMLRDVWVLTPAEAARPWPVTPQQARAWQFNPDTQIWSRP
jgi:hypothetical protein